MLVKVRISQTIDNEYANRLPEHLPLDKLNAGVCHLTRDEALAVMHDAEYNSDPEAVDIGPYGMPIGTFNAYKALAAQIRRSLASI